ncbi:MAG: gamma-glutamyl-gamma-aminobutyrate hydrolase family protein [Chloroflexi bacterium]|nr:gamma-glutamyl-gamma-aminobutyrate hydrolase family protein [Chloroflexota bacterium]
MPLIGITSGEGSLKPVEGNPPKIEAYKEAIKDAGGDTFIFHPSIDKKEMEDARRKVSGLLFIGGDDVDPSFFNEPPHENLGAVDKELDVMEIELARWAWEKNMPILGICRGIQVVNIALGGDVYQDLASELSDLPGLIYHQQKKRRHEPVHEIFTRPGSMLSRLFGHSIDVNSTHHQAVRKVAPGLLKSAWSKDEVTEGLEAPEKLFVILVQFHPELLYRNYPVFFPLFKNFIQKAGYYEGKKGSN